MGHENHAFSNNFILLGLFSSSQTSLIFFSFIVIIFIMTVTENAIMILLIHRESRLHTPMYFLLSHLSFMDILHISNIVPKMITDFLSGNRAISFAGCGFQIFLSLTLSGGECLLLAATSYDRYVAICHPLRYPILMNDYVSILMAGGSWLIGTVNSIVHTAYTLHSSFCGSRAVDHFFCEFPAMLVLSCVDTTHYERGVYSFSTCFFHMIVVIMYYGPFIFTYVRPKMYHTPGQDKFLAIFYTILTPSFNPIIYSFRNKDVLEALKNMIKSNFLHKNNRKSA
uniref:Olfactory receptor n=1 Tax=Sus scrofa TaxID=9823 RepID=A0A8D1LTM7_PIG